MSYFISLEGIEGSGKSTLQAHLADYLHAQGFETVLTREPGATVIGQTIRNILLSHDNCNLAPLAELCLFAADRAQHVAEVIKPALTRGACVISDRYSHSTLAYQGYARGISLDVLHELNRLATEGLKPDLVLLLDLEPEIGLARARVRCEDEKSASPDAKQQAPQSWSRFEEEELGFHQRVRAGYLELAKDETNNFVVLNAAMPEEELAREALKPLKMLLR